MIYDQVKYDVRCEWGLNGAIRLSPVSEVTIIVDILSFSTSVDIAVNRGATIFPYGWNDDPSEFALRNNAVVADRSNPDGIHLCPASLVNLKPGSRLVMPSPNGSNISLSAVSKTVIAGSLRNCLAVARYAAEKGGSIAVIPAGEQWEDGSLRPCIEDLIGAGAIISYLTLALSPEASVAKEIFKQCANNLAEIIGKSVSGEEKLDRAESEDVDLATELNVSSCVPILLGGSFCAA